MKVLAEKLQKNGFNIIQCPKDADTTKDSPVNVFADDTNILSLHIHPMTNSSSGMHYTYITNTKKEQRGEFYHVTDLLNALENHVVKYLFFAHAFTGCYTTSA